MDDQSQEPQGAHNPDVENLKSEILSGIHEQLDRISKTQVSIHGEISSQLAENNDSVKAFLSDLSATVRHLDQEFGNCIQKLEQDFIYNRFLEGDKTTSVSLLSQIIRPIEKTWGQPAAPRICLPDSGFSMPGYYGVFSMWVEEFEMLCRYVNFGKSYLEIGSLMGLTAVYLAKNNSNLQVTCVDAFTAGKATQGGVREIFEKNLTLLSNPEQVQLIEGLSGQILPTLEADSFDCILIDGDHSYEAVTEDSVNSYRVVKPGGYLLFHDYGYVSDVTQAVDEFLNRMEGYSNVGRQAGLLAIQVPNPKGPLS